jgi:hypothetical protein
MLLDSLFKASGAISGIRWRGKQSIHCRIASKKTAVTSRYPDDNQGFSGTKKAVRISS